MPLCAAAGAAVLLLKLALPLVPLPAECGVPADVEVAPVYRPVIERLVTRSPTLCAQMRRIAADDRVVLRIVVAHGLRPGACCRASTRFVRRGVRLEANVRLPASAELPELLAHELEHVVEQIEGLDLVRLSRVRDSGVYRIEGNRFETLRAQAAGRAARQELETIAFDARR
ncbi:MAG: hypothetical protein DIU54_013905 [Acidobacteriota bacterium]|jgi:hypothetical protein|nr:MAG: hypothetical protein DIU54_04250 [Acidobacteriota bacterium]